MRNILKISLLAALVWLAGGSRVFADTIGEHHQFFVNSSFDVSGRTSVPATLEYVSTHAYFYIDDTYLNQLTPGDRAALDQKLALFAQDFDSNIYPKETAFWGSEPNPGIDNDPRITIFLERLVNGTGGYFDSTSEYSTSQNSRSNQREMIVANLSSLFNNRLDSFLSHEFQHLISFNQKELTHNISEDTWLNELRSQYAITVTGYNDNFNNSDLLQREQTFLQNPTDSMTEWPNVLQDYASVTLFANYLAGRFGPDILSDTLHSAQVGIVSFNEWFASHNQSERFGDVFGDWLWANYINSSSDSRFTYQNPNLKGLRVGPTDQRLLTSSAVNTFNVALKPWQPEWYQFTTDPSASSSKNLKITWDTPGFQVFYGDVNSMYALTSGAIFTPPAPGTSFILMPVNETKTSNFGTSESAVNLSLNIEYTDQTPAPPPSAIHDGSLIMHAGTPDIYVITGPYKRLLVPEVLKFYGLDPSQAVTVSEAVFQSYDVSNYIRDVNEKKVYAVWPDGTKHWLNITAQQFTDSHRDWNSIFIVNDLESNYYKIGTPITQ